MQREEQETIIEFNEVKDKVHVYTWNNSIKNKLLKLRQEYPGDVVLTHRTRQDGAIGLDFEVSPGFVHVSFRPKKVMSEEQRAAARLRLLAAQEAKKAKQGQ